MENQKKKTRSSVFSFFLFSTEGLLSTFDYRLLNDLLSF
jgi:hypothetical protein